MRVCSEHTLAACWFHPASRSPLEPADQQIRHCLRLLADRRPDCHSPPSTRVAATRSSDARPYESAALDSVSARRAEVLARAVGEASAAQEDRLAKEPSSEATHNRQDDPEEAALGRALDAGEAEQASRRLQELQASTGRLPSPQACNKLLRRESLAAPLHGVRRLACQQQSSETIVDAVLSKRSGFRACWTAYQKIRATDLGYTTLVLVLAAAAKAREPFLALEVFRDMQSRGYRPNVTTWSQLISSFNKSKRRSWPHPQTAYELWQELRKDGESSSDPLDASAFAAGMMACVRVGRLDEALELLEEMRSTGCRPDIRAYNILLTGCAKASEAARIPRLLDGIAAAGLEPTPTTYNALINAYVECDMLSEARDAMERSRQRGVALDTWAYSSLIKGLVRSNALDEAIKLLREMRAAKVHPNTVTLTTILDGCVRVGRMGEAERMLREMHSQRVPANVITYNSLLRGYALAGDLKAVRDVLLRMGEAGIEPREDTFNTLMDAALRTNSPELVPKFFNQLVNLDLRPDSLSYTALITALSRLSQPDSALQAFDRLEADWGVCAISLNALVAALARANRIPEAEVQLDRAAQLAAEQGQPPPIEAYGAILRAYSRIKDADSAMDLFKEFQERGGEPDDRLVDDAVTACIRAEQFKRALQFVRAMERRGKSVDKVRLKQTLETVIRSEVQARKARPGLATHRNENLERLKFWVGFPNRYYDTET